MDCWLQGIADDVRARAQPRDEGSLWLVLFDDPGGAPVVSAAIEGAMDHMDDLMLRQLTKILTQVGAAEVLLVIPRRSGRPRRVDRTLWEQLTARIGSATDLLDLLVVGSRTSWSARQHDPAPRVA